ncbi:Wzz/FepE/Etk N-terminal domain-containing protein [Achromobacter xylosoxidans]
MHTRSATDDVDFGAVLYRIWSARRLIAFVTVIFTAAFAAYAYLAPPVYKTTTEVLPPSVGDLVSYNLAYQALPYQTFSEPARNIGSSTSAIPYVKPNDVYQLFLRKLSSYSHRLDFFEKHYLPSNRTLLDEIGRNQLWNKYSKEVTVVLPKREGDSTEVAIVGGDPELITKWATEYVEGAVKEAQKELLENLKVSLSAYEQGIAGRIEVLRSAAQTSRSAVIERLKNALKVAEAINLQEPQVIAMSQRDRNYNDEALYLRGARAIRAELTEIERRKNDDAYIPGLPQLLQIEYIFKNQNLIPKSVRVIVVDRQASPPEAPIKPQKIMLITLGIVLGLMVGLIAALLVPGFARPQIP